MRFDDVCVRAASRFMSVVVGGGGGDGGVEGGGDGQALHRMEPSMLLSFLYIFFIFLYLFHLAGNDTIIFHYFII